ncbi:TonB-dependent receptor plug domain-containing protein [Desulfosoma sp.]
MPLGARSKTQRGVPWGVGGKLPEGCVLCRAGLAAARHKKESSAPSASLWCIVVKGRAVLRIVALGLVVFFVALAAHALASENSLDPLLYFTGEDLSLLTVASRRPESPQRAPAVVRVITARDIRDHGYRTLADVLRAQAGFAVLPGERGGIPYLRGIREGILFLYDGVPLNGNVSKSLHPVDEDLSLDAVERIEIVLGPGSVLWGPDAYAGIVNIVPWRGPESRQDRNGRVRGWVGTQSDRGAGFHFADHHGAVRGALTLSAETRRFWDDAISAPPSESGASPWSVSDLEDSTFSEAVATLDLWDRLHLTGRLTDHTHRYVMHYQDGFAWPGEKSAPISFVKAAASQRLGSSDLSVKLHYANSRLELMDGDLSRRQTDDILAAEMLWYRPLGAGGGLTLGANYRQDRTRDAVVRDGFLPDFYKPPYRVFVPPVVQADFDNTLGSVFGQVRGRIGPVDLWAGLRYDDPDAYKATLTASAGALWALADQWTLKASLGTAYRTPYAAQLYADRALDPEGIRTAALELAWFQAPDRQAAVTAFVSRLSDHLQEDPYGGLSEPGDHHTVGIEAQGRFRVHRALDLFAAAWIMDAGNASVRYNVLQAYFVSPGGGLTPIYEQWRAPWDAGPSWGISAGLLWAFRPGWSAALEGTWTDGWPYAYDKGRRQGECAGDKTVRGSLRVKDVPWRGASVQLTAENLLDQDGSVPGLFGQAPRPPLRVWLECQWRF